MFTPKLIRSIIYFFGEKVLSSWYEKCMPRVKDIKPNLSNSLSKFKDIDGVKTLYVWGSYAHNIDHPYFRIRDIDILAKTKFNSGDLLAIDNKIITANYSETYLEDQGYDPRAVNFSKAFLKLSGYIDCWAISIDRKLLHWGPVPVNIDDSKCINKEAEKYASNNSGITRQKINKSSEQYRKSWYNHYVKYVNKYFEGMPTGWYKTEDIKIKDITSRAVKI